MARIFLKYIFMFIVLVLVQVLLCNHLVLFRVAVPFLFIYFIISLPMNLPRNWLLTLSFLIGFCVDIFSDTPGVNSLACTILAILKTPVFYAYVPHDDKAKVMHPTIATLGWPAYSKYLMTMSMVYCLLAFSIEYFSFSNVKDIVIASAASGLFTFVINLALGSLLGGSRSYD